MIVILFPLGLPDMKSAVDEAIRTVGGELMTNVVLTEFNYSFLFGVYGFKVTGDVWKKASVSELLNPKNQVFELQLVSEKLELISTNDPNNTILVEHILNN